MVEKIMKCVCKKMFVEILRFEDLNIKYVYIYNTKLEKKQEKIFEKFSIISCQMKKSMLR